MYRKAKLFRINTYKKQWEGGVPNGSLSPRLKEKFWRYVEAGAQSSNLFLVQFSFAIQNFRHDTWCSDCRGVGGLIPTSELSRFPRRRLLPPQMSNRLKQKKRGPTSPPALK